MPSSAERKTSNAAPLRWGKLLYVNFALGAFLCAGVLGLFWLFRSQQIRSVAPVTLEGGGSMWQKDDRFGFRHVPSVQGAHCAYQFKVTYTIDDSGFRITPTPSESRGEVYILGCSWTFGDGVDDDAPYPYVLASEEWRDYKIHNAACMAWGTSHALLMTQDILEGRVPPKMILYGWLDAHAMRNYLAMDWLEMLAQFDRKHPWFEVEDERPVFKGVVGLESGVERDAILTEKEWELSYQLILEMNRLCRERGVPFFVVSLPIGVPPNPDGIRMLNRALDAGVSWVDLSDICEKADFIPGDGHPAPSAHRKISAAIMVDPEISEVMQGDASP